MNNEEAIEYLKNYKYDNEVRQAIDTVLKYVAELENKDKQYKKLEETNLYLQKLLDDVEKLVIPKQKIRDKIGEIQKQYEETLKTANFKEIETMNKTNFKGIMLEGQRTILKELLESEN